MPHASYSRLLARAALVTQGTSRPVVNEADLAWHLNMSQQRVNGWQHRGVSKEGALASEEILGISANFIRTGKGSPDAATVDHSVSFTSLRMSSQDNLYRVEWGAMRHEALPDIFLLTVPDNAMADRVLKGHIARFNKHLDPRANDCTLVSDATGRWHIRVFEPNGPKRFTARATQPGVAPLDSERDKLTVLAVMVGIAEGRWG